MTSMSPRTIEATYENGLLRPLEPIQDRGNQVYLVTILNLDVFHTKKQRAMGHSLRGKYRGYLSSANEFAANFAALVRYIHRNPEKHGLIPDFREWP